MRKPDLTVGLPRVKARFIGDVELPIQHVRLDSQEDWRDYRMIPEGRLGTWESIDATRNGPMRVNRVSVVARTGFLAPGRISGKYQSSDYFEMTADQRSLLGTLPSPDRRRRNPVEILTITEGRFLRAGRALLGARGVGPVGPHGSELIASAWPTNPTWDAATFLGELRDGAPALVGKQLLRGTGKRVARAGGEWLNFQFAIKPLASDLNSFQEAANKANARLDQIRKDSGKPVKRRRRFPSHYSRTTAEKRAFAAPAYSWGWQGSYVTQLSTVEAACDVWMVGNFYYYIPPRTVSPALNDMMDKAKYVYGLKPGVDTAWELTPFSWAVDYFSNIGSLVKNLQRIAEGNQFGKIFVMRHRWVRERVWVPKGPSVTAFWEQKTRDLGNPFEVGGKLPTALQWANLLACGAVLSDQPGNFRR